MDNLLEALKTGSAFNVGREKRDGKRRTPRAAGDRYTNMSRSRVWKRSEDSEPVSFFHYQHQAERRAQLSRSRSRTNISNLENTVTREISFDDTLSDSPLRPSGDNTARRSSQQETDESEAEKLLARLRAL
ncbi:uncharacterized protein LOC132736727 [Ruditapes philippinarum]|uniref:uncharacterized protein LOC132736727 n=1 Tax=Ruditapes philippinarum TaxID=129788 RepID=UPI00295A8C9C|nr:uncharacterized protein LOC132736727 [Ruditapes philippinarum]